MKRLWDQKKYVKFFLAWFFTCSFPVIMVVKAVEVAYLPIEHQPGGLFGAGLMIFIAYLSVRITLNLLPRSR